MVTYREGPARFRMDRAGRHRVVQPAGIPGGQVVFTVKLPPPPSANSLFNHFNNGRGIERAKTKTYKAWITAAGWALNVARCQPIKGRVHVSLRCPENGRRDIDNFLKPTMDLLVGMSLIQGDQNKYVRKIDLEWHDDGPEMELTVRAI